MWISGLIATVLVVWVLAYWGAGTGVWIAALAADLVAFTVATPVTWYVATPVWLLTAAVVLLLGVPAIRQRYLTAPLLRQFRKVMPPMSATEQEALARLGSVADLFLVHDRPIARHVDDSVDSVLAACSGSAGSTTAPEVVPCPI